MVTFKSENGVDFVPVDYTAQEEMEKFLSILIASSQRKQNFREYPPP